MCCVSPQSVASSRTMHNAPAIPRFFFLAHHPPPCLGTRKRMRSHLEGHPVLDVSLQRLGNGLIEVAEDLHGKLRVDALIADQIVERIRKRKTDAARNRISQSVSFKNDFGV
jgi:hypothetical protein